VSFGPIAVTLPAPCKVNLTLDVFPPRPDGFHDLDSIVATFTPADLITVEVGDAPPGANKSTVRLFCDDPRLPQGEDNLAFRAARFFADRWLNGGHSVALSEDDAPPPPTFTVRLTKRLPHEAGLGGGSSDAAAVLRALASFFPPPSPDALAEAAAEIGSDVPLFLHGNRPVRMRGRGDVVEPLDVPLPPLFGVIVRPGVGVPTGPAYRQLDALPGRAPGGSTERFLTALADGGDIDALGAALHNDFEAAVLPAYPEVAEAHRAITGAGAVRALLCGSGSAVFGLARDRAHARSLADALLGRFPYVEAAAAMHNED
jgi:4-diphosphocytidyl-2-C-methyl-D-erythritol kinase